MERCPICRAALNGADTCRRCRAELGPVLNAERRARRLEGLAMRRLAAGDRAGAARLLRRSILIHRTPTALALRRLAAGREPEPHPAATGTAERRYGGEHHEPWGVG
jgi:hypothetical protein